jgi:hypothetical protein
MNTNIVREKPVYEYTGIFDRVYGEQERIEVYADDLRNAEVGKTWKCIDGNNGPALLYAVAKLVYKDSSGFLIITTFDDDSESRATWIELH